MAAIFLASHAIRRTGKPFDDLLSDMSSETLAQFVKDVTDRSAEEIDVSDVTKARQMLFDLVAENVALDRRGARASTKRMPRRRARRVPIAWDLMKVPAACASSSMRRGASAGSTEGSRCIGSGRSTQGRRAEGGERRRERRAGTRSRPPDYGRATRAESERKGGEQAEGMRDEGRGMRPDRGRAGTERVGALDAAGFGGMAADAARGRPERSSSSRLS